jgi:sulfur-oxidizing protein SoxY
MSCLNVQDSHARDLTLSRRTLLRAGGACAFAILAPGRPARATPEAMRDAIHAFTGGATVTPGRVHLDIPPLVENGNTVALTVAVDSPMTAADHVSHIHIFNEKNPQPYVAAFHLGPRAGKAQISTRIRLADSQTVTAIAQMSDGSFWSADADLIVTLAACTEDFIP